MAPTRFSPECRGLELEGKFIGFRLPARIDQVEQVLKRLKRWRNIDALHEQAYKTGWANIRDWVTAQMTLIETKMATMPEVSLPYMTQRNAKTLYESLEGSKFMLPGE